VSDNQEQLHHKEETSGKEEHDVSPPVGKPMAAGNEQTGETATNPPKEDKIPDPLVLPAMNGPVAIKDEVPAKKEATEINLEQTNVSELAGSQKNSARIFLNEEQPGGVEINIQNSNIIDEQKLNFHVLRKMNYKEKLDGANISYIGYHIKRLKEKFNKYRIAVINNCLATDEIAMEAAEALIFQETAPTNLRSYSCMVEQMDIGVEYIINQFQKMEGLGLKKKKSRSEPAIVVVYTQKDYQGQSSEFIKSLVGNSGIADAMISALEAANLNIIYICKDMGLFRKNIPERTLHFLLNISELHLYLFRNVGETDVFARVIRQTEIAVSEYGWLSKLNAKEKEEKLAGLIRDGTLETELTTQIRSIDLEETKTVIELAHDRLYSIVLFAAAFFERISISEFDGLIKALIVVPAKGDTDEAVLSKTREQVIAWEIDADEILANCGIVKQPFANGFSTYRFESGSRKENTKRIFSERYALKLTHLFEVIEISYIFLEKPISKAFMEGIVDLVFLNASNDQQRWLESVCVEIAERICNSNSSDQQLRGLFNRLLILIKKWNDLVEYQAFLPRFYHRMMETSFKRNIVAALLTHTCYPNCHGNLNYLKTLLDGSGEEEFFIKQKAIQIISLNYGEQIPQLLAAIDQWAENSGPDNLPHSFWFAKSSLLLVYYEKRFEALREDDVGYRILKALVTDGSINKFGSLVSFAFSNKSSAAFEARFQKTIKEQLRNEKFLEKALSESMLLFYAFILIQWHYLLTILRTENGLTELDVSAYLKEPLVLIAKKYGVGSIQTAMSRAARKYNVLIIQQSVITPDLKKISQAFRVKRDAARDLLKILETIVNHQIIQA